MSNSNASAGIAASTKSGRTFVLIAALLGWLFDGFEMGLFPVISRPALLELLGQSSQRDPAELEALVGTWNGITIAAFLMGAAAGGVLFGWIGDRFGRVKAMSLSILTYTLLSGLGAFATSAWQIAVIRFLAALGMGGEWALGVALVREVWGERSQAVLAASIGAAANAGYALVALLSMVLSSIKTWLSQWGFSDSWVEWRFLMLCGVLPALLTFFIRIFVPESQAWKAEQEEGATSGWSSKDLWGVFIGILACFGIVLLWSQPIHALIRLIGTLGCLAIVATGYLYPVQQFMRRLTSDAQHARRVVRRMIIGAIVSGIPLLGTWAAVQWAPTWADKISDKMAYAKSTTQLASASGAIVGGFLGALLGQWLGRRPAYVLLCAISMGSIWLFYLGNTAFTAQFLITVFIMGMCTASFYGWLPLYLPELFETRIRASGQGFSYNFGRILAAIGALQTGAIMESFRGGYPQACSVMALVYVLGFALIWLAPETKSFHVAAGKE